MQFQSMTPKLVYKTSVKMQFQSMTPKLVYYTVAQNTFYMLKSYSLNFFCFLSSKTFILLSVS